MDAAFRWCWLGRIRRAPVRGRSWAGCDPTANDNVAPSGSAPANTTGTATSSSVTTDCPVAVGGSFGGTTSLTVIDTVAGADVNSPSLTVNVNESVPKNPAAGVYVRFGADPDNVPWAGCDPTANDNVAPSGSDPANTTGTATSSSVTTDCPVAVGGSFGGTTSLTVIDTVAGADVNSPSLTVNVNESVPKNPAAGVYVRFGADPDNVPWAGCDPTANDNVAPSGSDPANTTGTATSSSVTTDCPVAVGGSFGGTTSLTVIDTVAGADVNSPSLTVNVNESVPKNPAAGVYVRFGADPDNVPWAGCDPTANDNVAPSGSDPANITGTATSSSVTTDCPVAVGGWLTVGSLQVRVAVSLTSLTVPVIVSTPAVVPE